MNDETKATIREQLLTPVPSALVSKIPNTPYLYETWSSQWARCLHDHPSADLDVRWVTDSAHGTRACVAITIDGSTKTNTGYSPNPEYRNPEEGWGYPEGSKPGDGSKRSFRKFSEKQQADNLKKMVQQDDGGKAAVFDAISRCLALWGYSLDLYWTGKDAHIFDILHALFHDGEAGPERQYLALAQADDNDADPSEAPNCPVHKNRSMRRWDARGDKPEVWKCTAKVGDGYCTETKPIGGTESKETPKPARQNGSYGSQRAGGDEPEGEIPFHPSDVEPTSKPVASDPADTAPSEATAEAKRWATDALKQYPHLAQRNHEQLVADCKAIEVQFHEDDTAGYRDRSVVEGTRTQHFGSTAIATAPDEAIRGYYAWLRDKAIGPP